MIKRFYLKEYASFKEAELEFDKGLILFSGASGAGKSLLINSILGTFGLKDIDALSCEAIFDNKLNLEDIGLESFEENAIKFTKLKSSRYFLNSSFVPKKVVKEISKTFIDYFSLNDPKEFENRTILNVLDSIISKEDKGYESLLDSFKELFVRFKKIRRELQDIKEQEKKIDDLKEFAKFEIAKIEEISPSVGEYEELLETKRELSKKDKILEAISKAEAIFECETDVSEALTIMQKDSSFFDDTINELRTIFESERERLEEYNDEDIEVLLDRIEKLSSLKKRYGSIEESLSYLENKKIELQRYENITFEKEKLQKEFEDINMVLDKKSEIISKKREDALMKLNKTINGYLKELYLDKIDLYIVQKEMDIDGKDEVKLNLWGLDKKRISTGEYNRVRVAFLSAFNDLATIQTDRVLILDEVDANLSGKESMSVARVLKKLSKSYQILAISHQPQLTSKADMHFLVYKKASESFVKELKDESKRVEEMARMISGESINEEAYKFAKSLIKGGSE